MSDKTDPQPARREATDERARQPEYDDSEQAITPMRTTCMVWASEWKSGQYVAGSGGECGGKVEPDARGFHVCEKCGVSYGRG